VRSKFPARIISLLIAFLSIGLNAQSVEYNDELKKIKLISEITPEHAFLSSFAGTWKIKGMNYSGDEPSPVLGKTANKTIMNGHYLEMDLEFRGTLGKTHARFVLGYDTRFKKFTFSSIDDFSNIRLNCSGTRTGKKIVFSGKDFNVFENKDIPYEIVLEVERENKFSYKVYDIINGKKKMVLEHYFFKQ
jgi:hypothetical protein